MPAPRNTTIRARRRALQYLKETIHDIPASVSVDKHGRLSDNPYICSVGSHLSYLIAKEVDDTITRRALQGLDDLNDGDDAADIACHFGKSQLDMFVGA